MCMSLEQEKKIREAREESIRKTHNVNATGEKKAPAPDHQFANQINNE